MQTSQEVIRKPFTARKKLSTLPLSACDLYQCPVIYINVKFCCSFSMNVHQSSFVASHSEPVITRLKKIKASFQTAKISAVIDKHLSQKNEILASTRTRKYHDDITSRLRVNGLKTLFVCLSVCLSVCPTI